MENVLSGLQPQLVFEAFEKISSIPRGSGNEQAISDYMVSFAKGLGLEVKQDEANNVYIKKPATKGYEHLPTVIIQGHLDMVCEKNNDTVFDFETQGLDLYIDGDFIRAKGTTLGADNGIAIAYQMALLQDHTASHPALEMFMTTEEETGMGGVANMHPEYLQGKVLLNIDTDIEGELLVSCAGGARAKVAIDIAYEEVATDAISYTLSVNGLIGGHSGAEIHHERANANKVMGRILDTLRSQMTVKVATISGGSKDNVITRECLTSIVVDATNKEKVEQIIHELAQTLKQEYHAQDSGIEVAVKPTTLTQTMTQEVSERLIDALVLMPNGIIGMSHSIEGLVETSLNLGVIQVVENQVLLTFAIRSSVPSKKEELIKHLQHLSRILGITCEVGSSYPAWVYQPDSKIRELAGKTYLEMYGKEAKIQAIHAGLECGFISEKLPGVDMISFGPNVYDIHSPEERASISSIARVYEYIKTLLGNMKQYE